MSSLSLLQIAFLVLVFVTVAALTIGLFALFGRSEVRDRLGRVLGTSASVAAKQAQRSVWVETAAKLAAPFARLSVPEEGWEASGLRRKFMHAGIRGEYAPTIFFGLKTALGIVFPTIAWLYKSTAGIDMKMEELIALLVLLLCVGYYLPNALLDRRVNQRKREIFEAFPDAIDLLTICVEAGLALEAAISRVAQEMSLKSAALADELQLVSLEFRAGAAKERALRNLALRTGVEDVDTLVAMLVQAEKFGTSIGDSLRIHSEMLRTKRMQRAEEAAAKIAVKLVIPLVLFIFPSILIVVAGPAMISISKVFSTVFGGG